MFFKMDFKKMKDGFNSHEILREIEGNLSKLRAFDVRR